MSYLSGQVLLIVISIYVYTNPASPPGFRPMVPDSSVMSWSWPSILERFDPSKWGFLPWFSHETGELMNEAWWFWTRSWWFPYLHSCIYRCHLPGLRFQIRPGKKNCRPRRGTSFASGQRLQMGYFINFWKTHGDYLGKSWISWDPFLGFIGIQIWIPWRKKNAPILVPWFYHWNLHVYPLVN